MKSLFFKYMGMLLFAGAISLSFASCSDDDDNPTEAIVGVDANETETFNYGQQRQFNVKSDGIVSGNVTCPLGWSAFLTNDVLTVTAPAAELENKENNGTVTVIMTGFNGQTVTTSFKVKAIYVIDFESVPQEYLAGPSAYGENLYSSSGYMGYLDDTSNLFFHTTTSGYHFASGGVAISQWNNKETTGYMNQCSVFYGDSDMKNGGFGNSSTFAVAYVAVWGQCGAYMLFGDENLERELQYCYVNNNTYAVLSMMDGDGFAKKFSYDDQDWFRLTFIGLNAAGETTGEVSVYLADFRTADAPGIITDWQYVDLTPLGKVNRVNFSLDSSDGSDYGMNTPAYFCIDNIAMQL